MVQQISTILKYYLGPPLHKALIILLCAGNIRVFCRCRPLSPVEVAANASSVAEFESAGNGDIVVRNGTAGKKLFKFDRVFSPQDDQGNLKISLMVSCCVKELFCCL